MESFSMLSLLLVISIIPVGNAFLPFLNLGEIVLSYVGKFNTGLGKAEESTANVGNIWSVLTGDTSNVTDPILKDIDHLKKSINHLQSYVTTQLDDIHKMLENKDDADTIKNMKLQIANHIQVVDEAYRLFNIYLDVRKTVTDDMLKDFLVKDCEEVDKSVVEIRRSIAPSEKVQFVAKSFPVLYSEVSGSLDDVCGTGMSNQQYLLQVFQILIATEAKAMTLLAFCVKLKYPKAQEWNTAKKILVGDFKDRYNSYVKEFSKGIATATQVHRACDPKDGWHRNTSYFELNKFNQAIVFHRGHYRGACNHHADNLNQLKHRRECENMPFDKMDCYVAKEHMCWGTLFNCFELNNIKLCPLKNDVRRLLWFKHKSGKETYGRAQDGCSLKTIEYDVGFCVCHCLSSHNKFSGILTTSNVGKNRVIIAVRLAYESNTVFLQIQEGTLGPNATITETFDTWRPTSPDLNYGVIIDHVDDSVTFDTLQGGDSEVLTGVGFAVVKEADTSRTGITITVAKFKYETGFLGDSRSIHPSVRHNDELKPNNENPIYSKESQKPSDAPTHYVKFQRSDLIRDAGQSTLPLWDAVPITGRPPFPLSGLSLGHKGTLDFAGFITLKVIAINIAEFFNKAFKPLS